MISRLNPRFNADEVASAVREALDNGAVPWDPGAIIGDGALTSSSMVREIARRAGLTPAVVRRHVGNDPLQTVFQPFLYGHDDMIDNAIGMADRARANGVTLNGTEDYIRHSLPEGSAINPAEINASWQNNARYHTELPEDDVFREILNPQAGSQTYWDAHPSPSVTPGPVDQPNSRLPRAPVYNDPNQVGIRISGHADDKYHGIDPLSAYAHELELNRLHNVSPSLIGQPREVIGSFIEPGATRRDTFAVRPMVETQRWHQDEFLKEYLMENGLLTGQGRPNNPLRRMSEGEQ